jgi:hypothetical protein
VRVLFKVLTKCNTDKRYAISNTPSCVDTLFSRALSLSLSHTHTHTLADCQNSSLSLSVSLSVCLSHEYRGWVDAT